MVVRGYSVEGKADPSHNFPVTKPLNGKSQFKVYAMKKISILILLLMWPFAAQAHSSDERMRIVCQNVFKGARIPGAMIVEQSIGSDLNYMEMAWYEAQIAPVETGWQKASIRFYDSVSIRATKETVEDYHRRVIKTPESSEKRVYNGHVSRTTSVISIKGDGHLSFGYDLTQPISQGILDTKFGRFTYLCSEPYSFHFKHE